MDYVKGILSGLTAIFLAESVPGAWSIFRGISEQKATGLGAVAGGLTNSAFSPAFWVLTLLFFVLFFAASRLGNKILRVFLFWIPTLTVSVLGTAFVALLTYVFMHFRHG
jgi:antibiotic biosynthesis monooxygenase (ABM) superfamily enzyme